MTNRFALTMGRGWIETSLPGALGLLVRQNNFVYPLHVAHTYMARYDCSERIAVCRGKLLVVHLIGQKCF